MAWQVTDPTGAIFEAGSIAAGEQTDTQLPIETIPGGWTFEVGLESATGDLAWGWALLGTAP